MSGKTREPETTRTERLRPLASQRRLAVAGRREQQDDARLALLEELHQTRPLDDPTRRSPQLCRARLHCPIACPGIDGAANNAMRCHAPLEGLDARGGGTPRAPLRRQPPLSARADARLDASGSSPVSSLKATGICRLRGTPSFCRRTSQCALAVLGEMPRATPTSSFDKP